MGQLAGDYFGRARKGPLTRVDGPVEILTDHKTANQFRFLVCTLRLCAFAFPSATMNQQSVLVRIFSMYILAVSIVFDGVVQICFSYRGIAYQMRWPFECCASTEQCISEQSQHPQVQAHLGWRWWCGQDYLREASQDGRVREEIHW